MVHLRCALCGDTMPAIDLPDHLRERHPDAYDDLVDDDTSR